MVVRWRVFLQSFSVFVRHIPGSKNLVADWLSRQLNMIYGNGMWGSRARLQCLMTVLTHVSDEEIEECLHLGSVTPPVYEEDGVVGVP